MKTAKSLFKIVFVLLVIFGLVASYVVFNVVPSGSQQSQQTDQKSFVGPTGKPEVKGPTGPPPTIE